MKKSTNILITGVSSGIGKRLVKYLLENSPCRIVGISRNNALLNELGKESDKHINSGRLKLITADISAADGITTITETIHQHWSHVDVLINNAGKLINKPFTEITPEEWIAVYSTNVFGPAQLIRRIIPLLQSTDASSCSHIVNIASMGGVQGSMKFAGLSAYSSSKAALIGLTECLGEELKSFNIHTNALALGSVDTEMFNDAFPQFTASKSVDEMAAYIADFSLKGASLFNGKTLQVSDSTP